MGVVNLKTETETTLSFTFYENGSFPSNPKSMVLPAFNFSIFDVDRRKIVTEEYLVEGWEHALYNGKTNDIHFEETDALCSGIGNCLYARSEGNGKQCGTLSQFYFICCSLLIEYKSH